MSVKSASGWRPVYIGFAAKSFSVVAGCGVWGFTSFEVANYLIFREKVPKFPPDLDLFSKPYIQE
ncbi:MAG: hypothetical protein EWV67_06105 [Microcystis sp. M_QC_C_20170808_M2Col]|nr:MAG: hypothetical protein EWV67_06105 [Microcystis sp. M_QC_C_20170808_M2Col]TRT71099.1 MAG: hypothetical protein EWV68_05255 [Microcystis sp. M_QC_C_20170808_M9Col]